MGTPTTFHPAVQTWFERRFPDGPTPAQSQGWPAVARRHDTLIAAPTGSGKTLAAFLVCIDALYRAAERGDEIAAHTRVVYVSPLKALGVDIAHNLEDPLDEIAVVADELGMDAPRITVGVRNGDTTPSERAGMLRRPPTFLVTTPESLYLLVTAERSRANLHSVDTVIVDEIHAVARDKRGSHLALTLERLDHVCEQRPVRVGLSATQRPIETIARLLVGVGAERSTADGKPRCAIVDTGHQRELDLALEMPDQELDAVASGELFGETLDRVAALVGEHHTTLVFVNTRRMAERVAHLLGERLGDEGVAAHHGSLSKDRRLRVERRLRSGDLRALVATASLELGIDIGPVDLVCQIGSPRSLATFLQRVGRSGHSRTGVPKGRLFPMTRDELVECTALLAGVRAGRLDAVHPPVAPLDILSQQLVAETAAERWGEDELFNLVRGAAPYGELAREAFDEVVELASTGIVTGRGARGAYVHRDAVNGEVSGRRGARLAALTSGGAIPETGDYRVVADPDDTFVGTVNEDWAIESMAGDVFLLGTTSWTIRRVEPGTVRVTDAHGAPPTVPFWLGEAPARTEELSAEVSDLRAGVEQRLVGQTTTDAVRWVAERAGVGTDAAEALVAYLGAGRAALGALPTVDRLVVERFFDETGGTQLVLHSPFGGRVNRALGLALRKRFCVTFDFELQAAASDDAVLLSLGPQHSFPLESVASFLSSSTVEGVLCQAVLASPMFTARWRWNLNRALLVLRARAGRRNPPAIQRMEADDLMAAVFPGLAACQENATGPIEIPDHPIVRQTVQDCLHEAMDVDALRALVGRIERGAIDIRWCETTEASPLAHEILNGRPYTFLDDAPLEERRSRAVALPRGLPVEQLDLTRLDPEAIERVRAEAAPDPRDADELADLLVSVVLLRPQEVWRPFFVDLVQAGRALAVHVPALGERWCALERRREVRALLPEVRGLPDPGDDAGEDAGGVDRDDAAVIAVRGLLDTLGPSTEQSLVEALGIKPVVVKAALARLEVEGFVLQGRFDPEIDDQQVCARRLLARVHRYSQRRERSRIRPVTAQDFIRFLLRWQHVAPGTQLAGSRGLLGVVEQLQGFEVAVGAWERSVLRSRITDLTGELVDRAGLAGELSWGRLGLRSETDRSEHAASRTGPSRATPVSFVIRADLVWLLQAARGEQPAPAPAVGVTAEVLEALRTHGALFPAELEALTRRLPTEIAEGLWDGVARGLITADSFAAVRTLLSSRSRAPGGARGRRRGLRHGARGAVEGSGRWSLLPAPGGIEDRDELAEAIADQLLARWGVVFRDLVVRETLALPWREVLFALRRMEARGTARGGRFVSGFSGEQYAHPDAVDQLQAVAKSPAEGELVVLSAVDPLNLVGILTPGPRVPAVTGNSVAYLDGLPVEPESAASSAVSAPARPQLDAVRGGRR